MNWHYRCKSFTDQFALELDTRLREAIEKKLHDISLRKVLMRTKTFEQYDGNVWVLKLTAPQNVRIVMEHQLIDGHSILFIREYISAGKYEPLWRKTILPRIQEGLWPSQFPLPKPEIEKALYEVRSFILEAEKKPARPDLPDELKQWLSDFKASCSEFCIYESEYWLKFVESEFKDELSQSIARAIKAVITSSKDIIETRKKGNICLAKYKEDSIHIALLFEDTGLHDQTGILRKILLHGCAINASESKIQTMVDEQVELLSYQQMSNSTSEDSIIGQVSGVAYKAYPDFALNEPTVWLSIQRNRSTSNLALSPEQIGLLSRIDFPKFINGQAGSGKSTMLYYLFAEMCYRKLLDDNIKGEMIFLTENPELLKTSRHEVREILRLNPHYATLLASEDLLLDKIADYFYSFDDFIYHKLLRDDDRDLFPIDKLTKFPQFKIAYMNSELPDAIKRKYSPELSWFIITTFIKGYHPSGYVSPEKETNNFSSSILFSTLSRSDALGIDRETFKGVYQNVWKFYKRLQENERVWDRLDIVRHINRTFDEPIDRKWVVFCDEAQDFTRIELQLLIRVSEYSHYDLSSQKLVPIVFAGDPFQTVNPTGFSLANLKRLFRYELCEQLNYSENSQREIVEDLRLNYRSTPEIVNLANVIQYIRYRYLKNDDLAEPQQAKHRLSNILPKIVFFDSKEQSKELFDRVRYDMLLIPSDDDKKEQNDFWKKYGWSNDDVNLKCAVSAKGAEYGRIILYRFGDYFCNHFGNNFASQMLSTPSSFEQQTDGKKFSVGFFFNKLYVAITRAQFEIVIVESSDNGLKNFWEIICNKELLSRTIDKSSKWSSVNITNIFVIANNPSDITASDKSTAYKNAEEEFNKAMLYRDSERMHVAANLYKQAESRKKSKLATAYSLKFNKEWQKASLLFRELEMNKEYLELLWIAGDWQSILSLEQQININRNREFDVKLLVARLMLSKDITVDLLMKNLVSNINVIRQEAKVPDIKWFDEFESQVVNAFGKSQTQGALRSYLPGAVGEVLLKYSFDSRNALEMAADFLYSINDFQYAVNIWNSIENVEHDKFYQASLKIIHAEPSTVINYMHKLGKYAEIIDMHKKLGSNVKNEYLKLISDSYARMGDFHGALGCTEPEIIESVFSTIGNDNHTTSTVLEALHSLIGQEQFKYLSYIDKSLFSRILVLFTKNAQWKRFASTSFDNRESRRQSESIFTNAYNADRDLRKSVDSLLGIISRSVLTPEDFRTEDSFSHFYDNLVCMYIEHVFAKGKASPKSTLEELCISLERMCGKFVDVLRLYDEVLLRMDALNSFDKKWLFERWLKVKVKSIRRTEREIEPEILSHRIDEEVRKKFPARRKDIPSIASIDLVEDYPSFDESRNGSTERQPATKEYIESPIFIEPEKSNVSSTHERINAVSSSIESTTAEIQDSSVTGQKNPQISMKIENEPASIMNENETIRKENIALTHKVEELQRLISMKDELLNSKNSQIDSKNSELLMAKEVIELLKNK